MMRFKTHICTKEFSVCSSQMIFITSSVFLKVKNHFPACGEKCLKQDASWYSPVMVIVRKADFYNKKRTNSRAHLWVQGFVLLFVVGATHHMTMTNIAYISVLQVLFEACIKESNLTSGKTRGYNESAWTDENSKVHLLRQLRAAYIQSLSQYNFDETQLKRP